MYGYNYIQISQSVNDRFNSTVRADLRLATGRSRTEDRFNWTVARRGSGVQLGFLVINLASTGRLRLISFKSAVRHVLPKQRGVVKISATQTVLIGFTYSGPVLAYAAESAGRRKIDYP